jgi:hypothetical protein
MCRYRLAAFASALVLLVLVGTVGAEDTLYVAPDGDDANDGSVQRPFGAIERAQEVVREKTKAGLKEDIVVYLKGGTYELDKTLHYSPRDGGNSQHSVTYAAAAGEKVALSGGRDIHGWKQGDDGLWSVDLPEVKSGKWFFRQLYADGKRLPRGRYPEEGFLKIKSVSKDHMKLQFTEPLPERDFGGQDTEVVVVQNWSISRELVTQSNPQELAAETQIGWVGHMACLPKPGMSAFLENALSLVTKPGQWYLDRKSGTLYYKAADGEDPNRRRFVAPVLDQLVDVEGTRQNSVRNLHFRGIQFEYTNWLIPKIGYGGIQACYHGTTVEEPACYATPVAIEMDYCDGCGIQACRMRHIGGSGIGIGAGCRSNRIVGCEIGHIGATGVNIGHMKVKDPLWADWSHPRDVPVNNEVANCYIHHCGADLWGAHGIFDAMTRDTKIRHNEVTQVPYGGIATGYVWSTDRTSQQGCLIEYNHVHEVMLKLNDSGCLYTLGFQPGSIIRGNLFHGVRFGGFAGGQVCNNGIFFDEGSKGFLLEDNVICDVDQKPGAKNTAVRFNRSNHAWQIWINNTIQTDAETPAAAKTRAEKAGLEPEYGQLLKREN